MQISRLAEMVASSNNIVYFGGAGTSTESSIPDFRSETGLYKTKNGYSYPPEIMLSSTFFYEHTEDFYEFYKSKMIYKDAKPNLAHTALAELERRGKVKAVITQNIDGLHQQAGSKNVLEIHGSVYRNFCINCRASYDLGYIINSQGVVPKCDKCNGIVKPDVVLYEEQLDMNIFNKAIWHISKADMLIVGGTSLVVYPASSLIKYYSGDKLVLINKSETQYDYMANLVIKDSIGKALDSIL
ncbi:MAG: NAD-dependent protein deacylase [Bacillota bacterium]|nr:NAD-dependent protein deacylase [Bacillota bacterium]